MEPPATAEPGAFLAAAIGITRHLAATPEDYLAAATEIMEQPAAAVETMRPLAATTEDYSAAAAAATEIAEPQAVAAETTGSPAHP